jgi:hypothetical protein
VSHPQWSRGKKICKRHELHRPALSRTGEHRQSSKITSGRLLKFKQENPDNGDIEQFGVKL